LSIRQTGLPSSGLVDARFRFEGRPRKPEMVYGNDWPKLLAGQISAHSKTQEIPLTVGLVIHDPVILEAEG
jgi:hypothetical protein